MHVCNTYCRSLFSAHIAAAIVLCMVFFFGCTKKEEVRHPRKNPALADLSNLRYASEFSDSGAVTLQQGVYRSETVPSAESRVEIMLTKHSAFGELQPGYPAAVAILVTTTGGSGVFYTLAVAADSGGVIMNIANEPLGDRIKIDSLLIRDYQIHLAMVEHGPGDPRCCPTQKVMKKFILSGTELLDVSP
jgi:hypothetical protein